MLPWNRILCPIDFSATSRAALEMALQLARPLGARVTLLHVTIDPTYPVLGAHLAPPGMALEQLLADSYEELERLRTELDPDGRANLELKVRPGAPAPEILQEAAEGPHDLIVMGTHGRTGLGRLVLGSVAELVVRQAPCPVLTIRHQEPPKERRSPLPVPALA